MPTDPSDPSDPPDAAPPLVWLEPGASAFPPLDACWGAESDAPGLLAVGADLRVETLVQAYRHGIFPWYSQGQPILWWSPDPRMVLEVAQFQQHHGLRKALRQFVRDTGCEIRFDHDFRQIISHCAELPRRGQSGTWIVPEMINAYSQLHTQGFAHSVEVWVQGELIGGLYCVAIGRAVFGESMFSKRSGASKIALAALVAFCRAHGVTRIDCQQNTAYLASLGARELPRQDFIQQLATDAAQDGLQWEFDPLYWQHLLHR